MNPTLLTQGMQVAITVPDRFSCYAGKFISHIDRRDHLDDDYYRFSVPNVPTCRFVLTAREVEKWVEPV